MDYVQDNITDCQTSIMEMEVWLNKYKQRFWFFNLSTPKGGNNYCKEWLNNIVPSMLAVDWALGVIVSAAVQSHSCMTVSAAVSAEKTRRGQAQVWALRPAVSSSASSPVTGMNSSPQPGWSLTQLSSSKCCDPGRLLPSCWCLPVSCHPWSVGTGVQQAWSSMNKSISAFFSDS